MRNVDIPMLDPYREEMLDKNFNTFSFGGHLNFEAYVQYQEYGGFTKAMDALRGMKLMLKGDDGKAVACNIKVKTEPLKSGAGAKFRDHLTGKKSGFTKMTKKITHYSDRLH